MKSLEEKVKELAASNSKLGEEVASSKRALDRFESENESLLDRLSGNQGSPSKQLHQENVKRKSYLFGWQ